MDNLMLVYQGGKRLQNTIPATAGNVVTNLSPDVSKRWKLMRGTIILVNDVTVDNRYINLQITDGTNIIENLFKSGVVIASETKQVTITEARYVVTGVVGTIVNVSVGVIGVQDCFLEGADQLRITIENGVAGDSYSGYLVVLEI